MDPQDGQKTDKKCDNSPLSQMEGGGMNGQREGATNLKKSRASQDG